MDRWPNLFVVGAPKGGTTSLHNYLNQIPQIFMSPIKEPNYFVGNYLPKGVPPKIYRDTTEYLSLFNGVKDETILGESSVSYLSNPVTAKLIHQKVPHAHIIITLRDPVDRIISSYQMHRKFNRVDPVFYNEIKHQIENYDANIYPRILRSGVYHDDAANYLRIFGEKQVKILIFENWIINPKNTMKEICDFLDIKSSLENFVPEVHNKFTPKTNPRGGFGKFLLHKGMASKKIKNILSLSQRRYIGNKIFSKQITKYINLTEIERKMLINFYQDDVRKLEKFLGCKLPWPNFKTD